MRRLRQELERRDLRNGYCTRPAKLACAFETVCETCVHFDTGLEFVPVLMRQRNHAAERPDHLVDMYDRLPTASWTKPKAATSAGRDLPVMTPT